MDPLPESRERRPELDAIRTLVVSGLILFHAGLVFDANDDYYVKNAETSIVPTILAGFGVIWAMPALFLISGVGTWHSLQRRGARRFAVERLLRLGVPLVFATITIIPVPVWLRLRTEPGYDTSYGEFLQQFFSVRLDLSDFPFILRGQYFETGHLWFVVLLLVFSLLVAPLALLLPRAPARRAISRLAAATAWRGSVLLAGIPLAVLTAVLGMEEAFAGWSRWAYLLLFVYGIVLASDDRFRASMRRDAPSAAVVGGVLFVAGAPIFIVSVGDPLTDATPLAIAGRCLFGMAGWLWLVAILGFADRWMLRTAAARAAKGPRRGGWARILLYLSLAALPVYILHQPILVTVASFVVAWDAAVAVKYAAIVAVTYLLTLLCYELIRRWRVSRVLFGMRARPGSPSRSP